MLRTGLTSQCAPFHCKSNRTLQFPLSSWLSVSFYAMSPESAYALLEAIAEIHGCTDKLKLWEMDAAEAKEQEEAQEISEERKERLSPFTFTKCNIQPGETIYFYTDPELTC